MTDLLFLATEAGVAIARRDGEGWRHVARSLTGQPVTSVMARDGVVLAGTLDGLWRSDDRGQTWQAASAGLTHRHVRWLATHPDAPNCVLVGTEPAAIFTSRD